MHMDLVIETTGICMPTYMRTCIQTYIHACMRAWQAGRQTQAGNQAGS